MIEYILKENHQNSSFTHLIFFDTESEITEEDDEKQIHRLRLGVAQYYRAGLKNPLREEIVFFDGIDLARWITAKARKKTALYCFAHNLAFDMALSGLLMHLPQVCLPGIQAR